jgi:lysophospholipase L1-like esterase
VGKLNKNRCHADTVLADVRNFWRHVVTTRSLVRFLLLSAAITGDFACSSDASSPQVTAGGQGAGGESSTGGASATGGAANTGGTSGPGAATGGVAASTGGNAATGGSPATGGSSSTGKAATGGKVATGGEAATGGKSTAASGGGFNTGGATGKGGTSSAGGAAGGASSTRTGGTGPTAGGATTVATGGVSATGGRASGGAGGAAGGTSLATGGSGGSTGFNPCKASPCVILPLGDSITHGFGSSDDAGYRAALYSLATAANQQVTFTGSLSNGRNTPAGFVKNHEGHDGISITGITGWVPPAKAFTATPHIVLLHIGTNDMTSNADPTTASKQLDTLITNLVAAAPDALVVVAKIIPLGYSNSNYTSYIGKIADVVKTHTDKKEHVLLLDMSTLPSSDIKGNGDVHPTDKGYSDMANLWYGAIKTYLP